MPGMTGLDLCRAVRACRATSYGYFILLTSKSDKTEVADGLDGGADDFLSKPVNPDELRARMRAGERILAMQARTCWKRTGWSLDTRPNCRLSTIRSTAT